MAHIQPWQSVLVLALWALPLIAYAAPRLADSALSIWRNRFDPAVTLFILLALAAAFYAFPSAADKGGPTNEPPPQATMPEGRINLYYHDADGRLIPLGAEIRRVCP